MGASLVEAVGLMGLIERESLVEIRGLVKTCRENFVENGTRAEAGPLEGC